MDFSIEKTTEIAKQRAIPADYGIFEPNYDYAGIEVSGTILVSKFLTDRAIVTLDKPLDGITYCTILGESKFLGEINEVVTDGMGVSGKIKYRTPESFVFDEYWITPPPPPEKPKGFWSKILIK
jgi:hypothetical protein